MKFDYIQDYIEVHIGTLYLGPAFGSSAAPVAAAVFWPTSSSEKTQIKAQSEHFGTSQTLSFSLF